MPLNPDAEIQPTLAATSDAQLVKALLKHPGIQAAYDQLAKKSSPENQAALKQAVVDEAGISPSVAAQYVRGLKMMMNNEQNPPSQRR